MSLLSLSSFVLLFATETISTCSFLPSSVPISLSYSFACLPSTETIGTKGLPFGGILDKIKRANAGFNLVIDSHNLSLMSLFSKKSEYEVKKKCTLVQNFFCTEFYFLSFLISCSLFIPINSKYSLEYNKLIIVSRPSFLEICLNARSNVSWLSFSLYFWRVSVM